MQTKLNPEQILLESWRSLDFDQQRQVLEFIQFQAPTITSKQEESFDF
jgi:hypothetical protein